LTRSEGRLERSDDKIKIKSLFKIKLVAYCVSETLSSSLRFSPSHISPTHITNNLPLVAFLLATQLTFSSMRCMNLTEMDSKLAGGGSDPYIQFVPLTDHLLKKQHNQQKRHTMTSNAFYQYPKTKVTRHNVNPVFQDIIELEVDVAREKDLLNGKFLALTVMDHDDLSEDDLIGTVVFNLASLTGADTGDGVRVKSTGRITRLEVSGAVAHSVLRPIN